MIIDSGTYYEGSLITVGSSLNVHGAAGQPVPVITSTNSIAVRVNGNGSTVSDLAIQGPHSALGLEMLGSSTVQRVDVRTVGGFACTIRDGITLRDSICKSGAMGGIGLYSTSGTNSVSYARNVTAVNTASGAYGVAAAGVDGGIVSIELRNVIALGDQYDAKAYTLGSSLVFANSNYDAIDGSGAGNVTAVGSGTNQTAAPIFLGAATGDFRQAPSSPTVDNGLTDSKTGLTDFERDARPQGAAIDIGADELDLIPPETAIDSGPTTTIRQTTATFAFSSPDGATFACRLDGTLVPCSATTRSYTSPELADGPHTFSVAASDAVGNADLTPAERAFAVDSTAPETQLNRTPARKTKKRTASFEFGANELGSVFECKLDSAPFKTCSSPLTLTRLKRGKHTFSVQSADATGNADASPATYAWKVKKKKKRRRGR